MPKHLYTYYGVYIQCPLFVIQQIVKQEWPRNWTSFISDIVGASKTSESLCTNNMAVFKLLRSLYIMYICISD